MDVSGINYSRITPEASMVMDKASRVISPLRQGAGKSSGSPDLGMEMVAATDSFVDF